MRLMGAIGLYRLKGPPDLTLGGANEERLQAARCVFDGDVLRALKMKVRHGMTIMFGVHVVTGTV